MATTPTPRSYTQILGGMISAFLAKFPIRNLKVGGPILSILEAAAQSDLRNTSETFTLLASTSLDSAEGTALDRIMADENTARIGAAPSTGTITVTDTRYTKLSTVLYQGKPAPLAGTATLYVTDASAWAASGSLYIGRGTLNYEGPLQYDSITPPGGGNSYYTINLNVGYRTTRYHNLGETVIMAQGGDRTISAGTICQTPQGNTASAVQFSVLYSVILPDGETSVSGVQIICTQPGTIGNVVAGSISEFVTAPFSGAVCDNTLALVNGIEVETDTDARARVRNLRQSRTRGTDLAIETYLLGVTSVDENKRIASAKVVDREGYPTTVYIDDGTGYEEVPAGVAYEVLTQSATGGEEYFQLAQGRPVTKAYLATVAAEPWNIVPLSTLTVLVGGVQSVHTFNATDFRNPSAAAAYEIVQSINANPNITFSARTHENNTKVIIFAKSDTNEDIQVLLSGNDANTVLQFPLGQAFTCRLYKNDILLSKDGIAASVVSSAWGSWLPIVDGDTLIINVDGTGDATYTFSDADFALSGTGYNTVSEGNSLAAWATVLNYKVPGVTAMVEGDHLRLTSNAGPVARGSITIVGGDIVAASMFSVDASTARSRDYTLNRNTGQLHLATALSVGDKLTAGTLYTRGFEESIQIASTHNIATGGNLYWLFDGDPEFVQLPLTGAMLFDVTTLPINADVEYTVITCSNGTPFTNVLAGDLVMLWDTAIVTGTKTPTRVAVAAADSLRIIVPVGGTANQAGFSLNESGITVARTNTLPYKVNVPVGAFYTPESLSTTSLLGLDASDGGWTSGGSAEVIRVGYARLRTNTYNSNGDVALMGVDDATVRDLWPEGEAHPSGVSHIAFAESGSAENSTPIFDYIASDANGGSLDTILVPNTLAVDSSIIISSLRTLQYHIFPTNYPAVGNNIGYVSPLFGYILGDGDDRFEVRKPLCNLALAGDRWFASRPYCIGVGDDLSVVFDNDVVSKRFDVTLARRVSLAGSTYATTGVAITDYDSVMFGPQSSLEFSFEDFALVMQPRVITDPATTSEILWRWNEFGANNIAIAYDLPTLPQQTAAWTLSYTASATAVLSITLPSNTEATRLLNTLTASCRIAVANIAETGPTDTHYVWLMTGFDIATMQSDGTDTTFTIASPTGIVLTGCGLTDGDTVYVSVDAGIPWLTSGAYVIHSVSGMTFKVTVATGGAQGPSAGATSFITFDAAPGADWTNVQAGDTLVLGTGFAAPAVVAGVPLIVTNTPYPNLRTIRAAMKYGNAAAVTVPVFSGPLADTSYVQAFVSGGSIADIVADINALTGSPVSAVEIGVGGDILEPTWYTYGDNTLAYPLVDGINYVQTTYRTPNLGGFDYTVDLKLDVSPGLSGYSEWVSEEAYLCPMTAANIASYLNVLAVCGISANGKAETSSQGSKVQLSTSTIGSGGSVQVRGGLANSALADVRGAAGVTTDLGASYVVVPTTQTTGFHVGWPVRISNSAPYVKNNSVSYDDLQSIVGNTWTFAAPASLAISHIEANVPWQIEKQGTLVAMVWQPNAGVGPDFSNFLAGDYVIVSNDGGVDTVTPNNVGVFVIQAVDDVNKVLYIENEDVTEELCFGTINLVDRDGILVGDKLVVSTPNWGATNQRTFTVASVTYVSDGDTVEFTTVETPASSGAVAGPQAGVQLRSAILHSLIKTLNSIAPLSANSTLSIVSFVEDGVIDNSMLIGEAFGSQLQALNKLQFPVATTIGTDGYAHSVGLVGEADKVMYGYETDPVSYPGVVAAGSNVNISGPLVKRIQIGLSLRIRGTTSVVFEAVRGAVATFINNSKVGESIAISDVVSIAASIGGVEAVSVSSPTYSTSSDRISVQPYEKPLVLQPDLDVTLTLIG